MEKEALIREIEAFAKDREIAPATVTSRAVKNSRLYDRLVKGGSCTLKVAEQVREWIADQRRQMSTPSTDTSTRSGEVA